MSDIAITAANTAGLNIGRKLEAITGVIITAGQDEQGNSIVYSAGNSTGYVLEIENPYGTPVMANTILSAVKLRGFRYLPYDADNTLTDPAVEIGDTVDLGSGKSVVHAIDTTHTTLMAAKISAPYDEEVNHEFTYEPRETRQYRRQRLQAAAQLSLQAAQIAAKVEKNGGFKESFGWHLDSDSFTLTSGNTDVMVVNGEGLSVRGKIIALAGEIGGCSIVDGVLKVSDANIRNIDASKITTGEIDASRISANSIQVSKLAGKITNGEWVLNLDAGTLTIGKISADNLTAGTINADNIIVTNINGQNIKNKTIASASIDDKAITRRTINDLAVSSDQIAGSAITEAKIGSYAVTSGKIDNYAVTSGKIGDLAVVTRTINDGAVSYGKTGFTGTLDQVGTNKANIETIYGYFTGTANFNYLQASNMWLDWGGYLRQVVYGVLGYGSGGNAIYGLTLGSY